MGIASKLFNGNVDQTLINRVTPTPAQREFLQTQWNDLATHLQSALSNRYGYGISTWIQGSYKYGTLIKPVQLLEEYDVDVGIYFRWTDEEDIEPTAKQLRDWVQSELLEYEKLCEALKKVAVPPKERCSRASYIRQFHIDTPVYHLNPETDKRRLACFSDKWESSDPKAIYKWFKQAVSAEDGDQLRRLVRYLKAWAAICFNEAKESRPTSIFLTVLTAQAYQDMRNDITGKVEDDDALVFIIKKIHKRLFKDAEVLNPIDGSEDLNRMTADAWDGFLPNLASLKDVAERTEDTEDEASAALIWSEVFSFLMPLPEIDEVEIIDEGSGRAVMQLPEIEIEVYSRNPKQLVTKFLNEVPTVLKNCDLVFKIINPHIIPEFATVEWTVRNEGEEADTISDLGHRAIGMRLMTTDEHTAYSGRHFMDCIVRVNGNVFAVRRVPVTVRNIQYPPRNSPKPAYTKLKSFLRRR
jgi:Adenylyl/Guanylyl and SMODS C-terminal sensor domain